MKTDTKPLKDVVSAVLDPKNRDLKNPVALALLRGARRAAGQTA